MAKPSAAAVEPSRINGRRIMFDQVGAAAFALMPLYRLIEAHVRAAQRLNGDDTTVPVMAKGKTNTARLWVYVRDDGPFAGADPLTALFRHSRDRRGEYPGRTSHPGQPMPMTVMASFMCLRSPRF